MSPKHEARVIEVEEIEVDEEAAPAPKAAPTRKPIAGVVLPEGFINPPIGEAGHLCVDPKGRYQPTWATVYISRSKEMPERQYFLDEKAQPIYVRTDMWVDVPPSVVTALRGCKESRITRGSLQNEGLTMALAEVASAPLPRFQYSVVPSA